MATPEWSELMQAPWGRFDYDSKYSKKDALEQYEQASRKFWERRGAIPDVINYHRGSQIITNNPRGTIFESSDGHVGRYFEPFMRDRRIQDSIPKEQKFSFENLNIIEPVNNLSNEEFISRWVKV